MSETPQYNHEELGTVLVGNTVYFVGNKIGRYIRQLQAENEKLKEDFGVVCRKENTLKAKNQMLREEVKFLQETYMVKPKHNGGA